MINQVGNNLNRSLFVPFKGGGINFDVPKPTTYPQNDEFKKEEKKQKDEKIDNLGYKIGAVALMIGFGAFGLNRLVSRRSSFKTNKIARWLGDLADKAGLQHLRPAARKVFHKSQVIFNVATIKDSLFKWITPKKVDKAITDTFERLSVNTSKHAYNKAHASFESMFAQFDKYNTNLSVDDVTKINRKIGNIRAHYAQGFSETARNQRLTQTKKGLSGLFDQILDQLKHPGKFLGKAKEGRFVAEDEASFAKIKLHNSISTLKVGITNSSFDKYHTTKGLLEEVHKHIAIKDDKAHNLMGKLRARLYAYKKATKDEGMAKFVKFPREEVAKDLNELRSHISSFDKYYDSARIMDITESIKNLQHSLTENKKGEIQEIMDIYRTNLSDADYKKLRKSVNKSLKIFNRAVNLESDKLFDKIRDLNLGSASHDVLALGLSLAGIGWGISKVDTKDERISVTLKYGIPALFGVGMAIACTVGLVASGPSLLIGLASTIPVNMIGKAIDNARKKKDDEPQASLVPSFKLESPMQMIREIENNAKKLV